MQISQGDHNTIGGAAAGAGNVISGNPYGVSIYVGSSNLVAGNLIGTNAAGNAALGNEIGMMIGSGSTSNTIGGSTFGARNVISGNTRLCLKTRFSAPA
jgi:parallel beta-helix repeat protein